MSQPQTATWQTLLEENAPDLIKNVSGFRESVLQDGALSLKVKTLMTMLCDALLGHADGVAAIANRAVEVRPCLHRKTSCSSTGS